jgi:hypothetical protein
MNVIFKLIAERRRLLGWSQEMLSSKSGVHIREIKKIELGADYRHASVLTIIHTIMGALDSEQVIHFGRDLDGLHQGIEKAGKKWSRLYEQCIHCGKTDSVHMARGLCVKCYDKDSAVKHTKHRVARTRGDSSNILTKEYLIKSYAKQKKSLSDICKECNCTRQYVHKQMKLYGISLRDKSAARILALDKNKIAFERLNEDGNIETVRISKVRINQNFFSSWTNEMAYVLGILYTDGYLQYGKYNPRQLTPTGCVRLAQKEPELLEKVLALMNCDARILYSKERRRGNIVAGEIYYFQIHESKVYDDLLKLGLTPRKSLTLSFPEMPQEYIRHFIRGCWDGDGSVYFDTASRRIGASFVSGSTEFIKGMVATLKNEGLPERRINVQKGNNPSYYIRFTTRQVPMLFHYLYDDVPEAQYLKRKYNLFKSAVDINS